MADISQIKSPDNTVYDIKDSVARDMLNAQVHMYYVVGPSTDTTAGTWTGTIEGLTAYYEGLTVLYVPAVAGAGTTKLNINGLGAVQCFYTGTTALTTHYPVGTPILLTYRTIGTTAGWRRADYNSNTTYSVFNSLSHGNGNLVADSAIYRYQMLFHVDENKVTPLNNVDNSTGTSKTILTDVEFDPFKDIYYYISTTNYSANAAIPQTYLTWQYHAVDLRYSLNISASVNALTAAKDVYMKVSPQSSGKVKLAAAFPLVQELPTTNDGYWYIFLGRASAASTMALYPHHPVYYHNGRRVMEKQKHEIESEGKIWYGVCDTAAATQAKEVTIPGITEYTEGMNVRIRFTYVQDYSGVPTLNINGIGAVAIKQYWDNNANRFEWGAGEIVDFCYSNERWLLVNGTHATTDVWGYTKLVDSTSSTSTTGAATPNSVKSAYDLATTSATTVKQTSSSGNSNYNLLFTTAAAPTSGSNYGTYYSTSLKYNPSTKALNTNGTVNGYTLADACAKSVDTAISDATSSANLPTTDAVKAYAQKAVEVIRLS